MRIFAWFSSHACFGGSKMPLWAIHAKISMNYLFSLPFRKHMQHQNHAKFRMGSAKYVKDVFGGHKRRLYTALCEYSHGYGASCPSAHNLDPSARERLIFGGKVVKEGVDFRLSSTLYHFMLIFAWIGSHCRFGGCKLTFWAVYANMSMNLVDMDQNWKPICMSEVSIFGPGDKFMRIFAYTGEKSYFGGSKEAL